MYGMLSGGRKLAVACVYVNPEGVRSVESERLFEEIQENVLKYEDSGFEVVVMGDFNAHIGLGNWVVRKPQIEMGTGCCIW